MTLSFASFNLLLMLDNQSSCSVPAGQPFVSSQKAKSFFIKKFFLILLLIFLVINLIELGYIFIKTRAQKADPRKAEEYVKTKLEEGSGFRSFNDKYIGFRGLITQKGLNDFWIESQTGKARVKISQNTVIRKPNYGKSLKNSPVYDLQEAPNLTFDAVGIGQVVDVVGIGNGNEIDALSIVIENKGMDGY